MTRAEIIVAVRAGHSLAGACLTGACLSGAYLSGADLSGADLSGADLSGADLSGADLSGADLSGACLSGADLSGACLTGACLTGACLDGAHLSGADLRGADIRGADIRGAQKLSKSHDAASEILRRAARTPEEERWAAWPLVRRNRCVTAWRQEIADAPAAIRDWVRATLIADPAWGFSVLFADAQHEAKP